MSFILRSQKKARWGKQTPTHKKAMEMQLSRVLTAVVVCLSLLVQTNAIRDTIFDVGNGTVVLQKKPYISLSFGPGSHTGDIWLEVSPARRRGWELAYQVMVR